jgi:predicted nucleotidyltransferase
MIGPNSNTFVENCWRRVVLFAWLTKTSAYSIWTRSTGFGFPWISSPSRRCLGYAHNLVAAGGDFVMNVAGFEEALVSALCIELEPGLAISVASLPGLAILKMIAWAERHSQNNKDAADLYKILIGFEGAGNQNRIFDEELPLLESVAFDLTLAGAQLLGRDVARIADSAASLQIAKLLNSETQVNLLVSHMIATASYEENAASVARIFACFRQGYLESAPTTSES